MAERETVVGRLGQEPLTKSTSKGEVVEFTLARSSRLLGPDGLWTDGETTWYRVSAWDRLGANAARSLHKGQPVIVHGQVFTHRWVGRDGDARSELRIKAAAIGHDLNSGIAAFARADAAAVATPPALASVTPPVAPPAAAEPEEPAPWNTPLVAASAVTDQDGWATTANAEGDPPF